MKKPHPRGRTDRLETRELPCDCDIMSHFIGNTVWCAGSGAAGKACSGGERQAPEVRQIVQPPPAPLAVPATLARFVIGSFRDERERLSVSRTNWGVGIGDSDSPV